MPNARKTNRMDGSELRNTLKGTEHRKEAEMRNVWCRGERLGLSLCAVSSPRGMWGSFNLRTERGLQNNEGIVSGVVMPVWKTDKD